MKNVNPFFMFTIQVPNGPKSAQFGHHLLFAFLFKIFERPWDFNSQSGKLFGNVGIHFSTPLGVCLSPKTLSQLVSPMFLPWS
jgi:hypothetical protein